MNINVTECVLAEIKHRVEKELASVQVMCPIPEHYKHKDYVGQTHMPAIGAERVEHVIDDLFETLRKNFKLKGDY